MKIIYDTRRVWRQLGRVFSTAKAEVPKEMPKVEKPKNKFIGDGVEFFKNALHKDNLPLLGILVAGVYVIARGSHLESRVDDLEKKVDKGFAEMRGYFSVIMVLNSVKNLPDDVVKAMLADKTKEEEEKAKGTTKKGK